MYFNLKHKKTGNERNLSLDEFLKFIGKNVISDYSIEEKDGNPGERKHREKLFTSGEKELAEFRSTISFSQKNDIQTGYKEISFNSEIGYFLKVLKKRTEIYVPTTEPKTSSISSLLIELRSYNENTEHGKRKIATICRNVLKIFDGGGNVCRNCGNDIVNGFGVDIVDDLCTHENHGGC